jgi:hypothetical protein
LSKRRAVFAAVAVGVVSIALLAFLLAWRTDPTTTPSPGASIVLQPRSPASLPSGGAPVYDHKALGGVQSSARDIYLQTADMAKVFAQLEARPEPEAKYYAYRAVTDCELFVLGGTQDWHSIDYEARALMAAKAHDGEIRQHQIAALEALKTACQGFTRPNGLPTTRAASLLKEAAHLGHPSAQLAQQRKDSDLLMRPSFDLEARRAAVQAAWRSDDPTALMEVEWALMSVRHDTPVVGLGTADVEVLAAALILARCELEPDCGNVKLMAAIRCIALAECSPTTREAVLRTLPEQQRHRAEDAARRLVEAFREKNPALLYARPPTR